MSTSYSTHNSSGSIVPAAANNNNATTIATHLNKDSIATLNSNLDNQHVGNDVQVEELMGWRGGGRGDDDASSSSSFPIPAIPPPMEEDSSVISMLPQHEKKQPPLPREEEGRMHVAASWRNQPPYSASASIASLLSVIVESNKSSVHFRSDLSKSDRRIHPCGILHFTRRMGTATAATVDSSYHRANAPEEHVFAWIANYHNKTHVYNTLMHMQQFGFIVVSTTPTTSSLVVGLADGQKSAPTTKNANTTVTFLPYSSRRSWIEKYPCAFPHIYCGDTGVVSGYPYWSDGHNGTRDDIILRATSTYTGGLGKVRDVEEGGVDDGWNGGCSGTIGHYYDRLFQTMKAPLQSGSCANSTAIVDGGSRRQQVEGMPFATSTTTTTTNTNTNTAASSSGMEISTAIYDTHHHYTHPMEEDVVVANTGSGGAVFSVRGRKKKKIFPTAHLFNEERDELHLEMYKYFDWLLKSFVAVTSSSSSSSADGLGAAIVANEEEEEVEEENNEWRRRGRPRKLPRRSSTSSNNDPHNTILTGGGGGGGIHLASLQQLIKCMESTFKVVGNHVQKQSISSCASLSLPSMGTSTPNAETIPPPIAGVPMPFLEEALSEPLRKLAAITKQNIENKRSGGGGGGGSGGMSSANGSGIDFDEMFARLLQFQQEHGHVNVPQKYASDGQLGSWVANIRSKRKAMSKRGEEFESDILSFSKQDAVDDDYAVFDDDDNENEEENSSNCGGVDSESRIKKKRKPVPGKQRLTQERIHRLDSIGFQWVLSTVVTKSWEARFEELKEYQQYHGTTRVPRSSGTLGEWVHSQRRLYNKRDKNFLATRAPLLDEIGFDWHPRKYALVSWEDNFNRLVNFGRTHRHYNVQSPFPDDYLGDMEDQDVEIVEAHRFAKWVKRIHAEYRAYTAGKEGRMLNDARVMQLREIGFQFV